MLYLDLETYNEHDLSIGTYRYAETAEILLFAWAVDDGPVQVWDVTADPWPLDLIQLLEDETLPITAHNAMFDRIVLASVFGHRFGTQLAAPERWRCTAVKALSHGFPFGLDIVGRILGLPTDKAKLKDGKKLINRFCSPAPKNHKAARYDRHSHPEEWARFIDYAAQDIVAMREIDKRLPDWNWRQRDVDLYHLDQRINDRGFEVDQELTRAGAKAAAEDKIRMAREFIELTGGAVEKPTQREQFRKYLNDRFGLRLDNTRAETFRELLAGDRLDPVCRQLMEISILSNKTSTAKYATLAPAVSSDGRFRGGLQFRGAARTRRWAGRTFQPQNLPSRGLPAQRSIEIYIDALKTGVHDLLFDDQMLYASAALRGVVVAPAGKRLGVADLSNIEGRVNAWLAGETWKLKAFAAYDRGEGPDLYNVTAGDILGQDPYEIAKTDRNVFGKVPELALGYEGGFGALETFCKSYGVRMVDHADTIRANIPAKYHSSARTNYTKWGQERNPEADPDEWLAREAVKLAWRGRHPKIVQLWKACKEAATNAIEKPGKTFQAGPWLKFSVREHAGIPYLLCRLPSGAFLTYFQPKVSAHDGTITYMGVDTSQTGGTFGPWRRMHTYGGKLVENACQSLAMDIMAANMPGIDASGMPILLTVHDEIITEMAGNSTAGELAGRMATCPDWLPDFPLAAAGFETARYRKD